MIRNKQYFYYSLNMGFKAKKRTTSFISMTCRSHFINSLLSFSWQCPTLSPVSNMYFWSRSRPSKILHRVWLFVGQYQPWLVVLIVGKDPWALACDWWSFGCIFFCRRFTYYSIYYTVKVVIRGPSDIITSRPVSAGLYDISHKLS